MLQNLKLRQRNFPIILLLFIGFIFLVTAVTISIVQARPQSVPNAQGSPIHPNFPMLDEGGGNVLDTGNPVSTLATCGQCHDTEFITQHSFHVDVGLSQMTDPGETGSGRPWDTSPGWFGRWNPIVYQYLSPLSDKLLDLGTPEWLQLMGIRHVGGGPAQYSRDGELLTELPPDANDPETSIIDPETGELMPWNWSESGVIEMNCFLCHTSDPNSSARVEAIEAGDFSWANTATLVGTGVVEQIGEEYRWNPDAFNSDGELDPEIISIQDPSNENCGQCHGLVQDDLEEPVTMFECTPDRWSTITTGQIISPQRISDSGMNLEDKEDITRSWDVHAERLLNCTDCHFSLNNPVYFQESEATRPDYLTFDPRRLEIGEYIYQPLHEFALSQSAQRDLSAGQHDTMRRCESCHSIERTHNWLPYKERHTNALSCETCHIPKMYSSAAQQLDWTVVDIDGKRVKSCRGVDSETSKALITGFVPTLMPREDADGNTKIAPFNLVTAWYWRYGDPERPIPLDDLQAVYLGEDGYHLEILTAFDQNNDGSLAKDELIIDTDEKHDLIAARLEKLGYDNPRIVGEIQPYNINHTVTHGEWATKDCQVCHGGESLITQPFKLASYAPGGVIPEFVQDSDAMTGGEIYFTDEGELYYQPVTKSQRLYILGHNSVSWVDLIGSAIFLAVLIGIIIHATIRFVTSLRNPKQETEIKRVYMYSTYERLWHWLQTFTIVLLIFTGLIIHKPDTFGIFSFSYVVQMHNILAAILAINAGLALFYHLASGEIKQYIPRPRGFFDLAINQAMFYMRGIFKGSEHPFDKTPERKLNPLQQVTYIAILNILLPLQGLTGIMMWGAQRWPGIVDRMGGLPFLAPFHTLIAWLFVSFIVLHVYLTTTGHKPLAGIKSMMIGWDEIEIHHQSEKESLDDDDNRNTRDDAGEKTKLRDEGISPA